jgi:hypothetical protein
MPSRFFKKSAVVVCAFKFRQRGDAEAQRDDADMHHRDNADA